MGSVGPSNDAAVDRLGEWLGELEEVSTAGLK